LKELLLYSFRISGTTTAPSGWNYNDTLPLAFRPPAPQEHEIRATKLFETDKLERTSKPMININKLQSHNHISIAFAAGSVVRYTIDNSLPSDLTGKIYEQPFIVPAEADFVIKAVAFMEGKKESEVVSMSVQGGSLVAPGRIEHVAERPVHIVSSRQLDLGLEVSPYSSSRHSSDDDNDHFSPFNSFNR
jgi:Fn3 associated